MLYKHNKTHFSDFETVFAFVCSRLNGLAKTILELYYVVINTPTVLIVNNFLDLCAINF